MSSQKGLKPKSKRHFLKRTIVLRYKAICFVNRCQSRKWALF